MQSIFLSLALALVCSSVAFAQPRTYTMADTPAQIDSTTGGMIYSEVVKVDSASSAQLYSRAKSFLLKAFTNESPVIQLDDKENGIVGGRGKFSMALNAGQSLLTGQLQMYYEMAVEIRVKPGRYRYEFSNIEFVNRGTRVKIDDALRKNPKAVQKYATRQFSQKEYDKYMSDKNPINILIRQLKQTMNPATDKSNF